MLPGVSEGRIDLAILPAGIRLPEAVSAASVGALQWRCFARRGHAARRSWGRKAWARSSHVVVRVGDRLRSPVDAASSAAGIQRSIGAWVPNFGAVAPLLAAFDLLATTSRDRPGGSAGAVWARGEAGADSHRSPAACHGLERATYAGSGDRMVPRAGGLRDGRLPNASRIDGSLTPDRHASSSLSSSAVRCPRWRVSGMEIAAISAIPTMAVTYQKKADSDPIDLNHNATYSALPPKMALAIA